MQVCCGEDDLKTEIIKTKLRRLEFSGVTLPSLDTMLTLLRLLTDRSPLLALTSTPRLPSSFK